MGNKIFYIHCISALSNTHLRCDERCRGEFSSQFWIPILLAATNSNYSSGTVPEECNDLSILTTLSTSHDLFAVCFAETRKDASTITFLFSFSQLHLSVMMAPARPLKVSVLLLEIRNKGESGHLGTHLFKTQHVILTSDKNSGNHDDSWTRNTCSLQYFLERSSFLWKLQWWKKTLILMVW